MKKDIHPDFYETKVECACGNSFTIGSSKKELNIEICSDCHPFYTGEKHIIDSTGRVERFKKLQEKSKEFAKKKKSQAKEKKAPKKTTTTKKKPKTTEQTTLKNLKKK